MTHHESPAASRVTANLLLDDDDPQTPRRHWRQWWAWASLVAALSLAVSIVHMATPVRSTPVRSGQVIGLDSYSIEKTVQVGDLTVVIGSLVNAGESVLLNLFTINTGERALPAGMILDDGEGHQIDVGTDEHVPARTLQHRVIEVDDDFAVDRAEIVVRDNLGRNHR